MLQYNSNLIQDHTDITHKIEKVSEYTQYSNVPTKEIAISQGFICSFDKARDYLERYIANTSLESNFFTKQIDSKSTVGIIDYISVNPVYKNKGYGTKMLDSVKSLLISKKVGYILLIVAKEDMEKNDLNLLMWYKRCGFSALIYENEFYLMGFEV